MSAARKLVLEERAAGRGHWRRQPRVARRGFVKPTPVAGDSSVAPGDLANIHWLWDVDNVGSRTESVGRVTQLDDLAGSSNLTPDSLGPTLVSADATFNGRDSVAFTNAGGENLENVGAIQGDPITLFCVFAADVINGFRFFNSGGAPVVLRFDDTPGQVFLGEDGGNAGVQITAGWSPVVDTPYLFVMSLNGTSTRAWANGTELTFDASTFSAVGFNGISWGSNFFTSSDVSFTLMGLVTGAMSESDRDGLHAWAQANAGVA